MRRSPARVGLVGLVMLLLLGVSGCGSDATVVPTNSTTTDARFVAKTRSELEPALLTPTDLTGSWKPFALKSNAPSEQQRSAIPEIVLGCPYLQALAASGADADLLATGWEVARVAYMADNLGPFISHGVSGPGASGALGVLRELRAKVQYCKTVEVVDDSKVVTRFDVSDIAVKKAGDDTFVVRLDSPGSASFPALQIVLVAVRQGDLISHVAWFGFNAKADNALVQMLADRTAAKLTAVK